MGEHHHVNHGVFFTLMIHVPNPGGCYHIPYYPLVMTNSLLRKTWPIEIVDLPIESGDFPVRYVSHYQRVTRLLYFGGVHLIFREHD